jgi:hypothetical protein
MHALSRRLKCARNRRGVGNSLTTSATMFGFLHHHDVQAF